MRNLERYPQGCVSLDETLQIPVPASSARICFRRRLNNSGVPPGRGYFLRHSREACPVLRYGDGNLKPFFQGVAVLQTAFLDSCLRRNDGEGNSCGMTLRVIQRSASAAKTGPYKTTSGYESGPFSYPLHGAELRRSLCEGFVCLEASERRICPLPFTPRF